MLTIMIILMLLNLLYDGIGAFYSQAIVSAKNPYAAYREALAAAAHNKEENGNNNDGGDTDEFAR